MNLSDIENLTFAELKAKKDEAIEAGKASPLDDLAARYVQARMDAKHRDEKLAEQGTTITLLQEQVASFKSQAAQNAERADKNAAAVDASSKALAEQKQANAELTAEATKAKALAKARRAALASVMQVISPVLADE